MHQFKCKCLQVHWSSTSWYTAAAARFHWTRITGCGRWLVGWMPPCHLPQLTVYRPVVVSPSSSLPAALFSRATLFSVYHQFVCLFAVPSAASSASAVAAAVFCIHRDKLALFSLSQRHSMRVHGGVQPVAILCGGDWREQSGRQKCRWWRWLIALSLMLPLLLSPLCPSLVSLPPLTVSVWTERVCSWISIPFRSFCSVFSPLLCSFLCLCVWMCHCNMIYLSALSRTNRERLARWAITGNSYSPPR